MERKSVRQASTDLNNERKVGKGEQQKERTDVLKAERGRPWRSLLCLQEAEGKMVWKWPWMVPKASNSLPEPDV